MSDWIRALAVSFARRLVQEAEMQEQNFFLQHDNYVMRYILQHEQEQSFAQGECPNCGHDWTAHSDFIARGEKTCWTFDPAIMDDRHPYHVADVIASECDIADQLAVIVIQCDELVHTDERTFCGDETCPCMDELYAEVDRWEQHEPGDERYYR